MVLETLPLREMPQASRALWQSCNGMFLSKGCRHKPVDGARVHLSYVGSEPRGCHVGSEPRGCLECLIAVRAGALRGFGQMRLSGQEILVLRECLVGLLQRGGASANIIGMCSAASVF